MNQNGKGQDGFRTPELVFRQLNEVFSFTVDAACNSDNKLCAQGFAYDKGQDGLVAPWEGCRVFCNPPFSEKAKWIKKAHDEVMSGKCPVCVMILPTNSMDSKPWHEFIYGKFHYQILGPGRVSFLDPETGKPKTGNNSGTTIVYFFNKPSIK